MTGINGGIAMASTRREEFEQRLIDHEVRVTRAREAVEQYQGGRQSRAELRTSAAEDRWFREQLITMLAAASTLEDLAGLGLTDELVRTTRLGDSLAEAWARHHHQSPL
jgi:type II secretory pathway component PulF